MSLSWCVKKMKDDVLELGRCFAVEKKPSLLLWLYIVAFYYS